MRNDGYWRAILLGCAVAFAMPVLPGAQLTSVKTDAGTLSGLPDSGGVVAYLGIPYAAPPVADRRWRAPETAQPWTGVRNADRFGTSCVQNQLGSRLPWTEEDRKSTRLNSSHL